MSSPSEKGPSMKKEVVDLSKEEGERLRVLGLSFKKVGHLSGELKRWAYKGRNYVIHLNMHYRERWPEEGPGWELQECSCRIYVLGRMVAEESGWATPKRALLRAAMEYEKFSSAMRGIYLPIKVREAAVYDSLEEET